MKVYFQDNFFSSGKTEIVDQNQQSLGELDLKSAFSSSVDVYDAAGTRVASFARVSGWLWPNAFCLELHSPMLERYELIAVIMGMHEIQKRHNAAATI